ncbi:hypothetical protein BC834DRAFT_967341 [Gloeopeniophorella convolvens]|nr:hypothetical protein BC834DRAFT_967341 [Gloeopeniophorella convolvens]
MSFRQDKVASYDHSLLSAVPDPTRAEKQEGYNVDLLEEGRNGRAATPPPPAASEHGQGAPFDYSPGAVGYARNGSSTQDLPEPVKPKTPWYRTKYGIIGIIVALLVIIAAAVGGGVGGTQHHHHSDASNNATNQEGQSGGQQGVGGSSSSGASSTSSAPSGGQSQGVAPVQTPRSFGRNVAFS